jgi:hypothetical protein
VPCEQVFALRKLEAHARDRLAHVLWMFLHPDGCYELSRGCARLEDEVDMAVSAAQDVIKRYNRLCTDIHTAAEDGVCLLVLDSFLRYDVVS